MRRMRARHVFGIAAVCLALPIFFAGVAQSHGYTQNPPSRSYNCAQGTVNDCGAIQWEPQSVEGPKGFPQAGPQDGQLCAADNASFAELDDPRGGQWPAVDLTAGRDFQFTWSLTARHATTSFRYFVTKDGWDPSAPLTRDQLEPEPFLTVDFGGQPPATVEHTGRLPDGKSGRHLIYGVWDVADTGNAFYSCADVNFG
ncbi:MAG: chitin-binding protein [Pseudonocardiaceae bacterium]|nr:chitin-binding protein [Pseudonocardiaceae bacterium]